MVARFLLYIHKFHTPQHPRARPLAVRRGVGKPFGRFPHGLFSFGGSTPFPFLKEKRKWGRNDFFLAEKEKNGFKKLPQSARSADCPLLVEGAFGGRTKSSAPTIAWPMPCSSLYPLRKKETRQKPCQRVTRLARAAQRPDTHAGTERPHRGLSSADADALFEPLSAEPKRKDATFVASFFLERVTRLELATSTLARWRSTG